MAGKDLTTIKVPGKNTRDQRRRNHSVADTKKSHLKRGRPMRSSKSVASSSQSSKSSTPIPQKPPSLRNMKSHHKLAHLEKLPIELLTRIFLLNPTPSLPLSSPIIASKLSSEHIYTQCLILTFGPYWEQQYRQWKIATTRLGDPIETESSLPNEPDSQTQSSILRCRWATLTRLRHAESTFLILKQKILLSTPHQIRLPIGYDSLLIDSFTDDFERFMSRIPDLTSVQWYNELNTELYWEPKQPLLKFREGMVNIPASVLRGPWTEDKVVYLWYLRRAGAKIDKHRSTAGEEATTGLELAILSHNIHAVYLLTKLNISIPFTTPLIFQFLQRYPSSFHHITFNDNTTTVLSPPPETTSEKILQAFISFFAYHLTSKYSGMDTRKSEVEREILELRKNIRNRDENRSEEKRKEVEWIIGLLAGIYG